MVRRRWPDVLIVLGVLVLLAGGILALWGDDIRHLWGPDEPEIEQTPPGGGLT
ncbi:MAG: hypothetical protein H6709_02945 [Kofleriaceae bacterium]|nr:hypothetical protein [Kofleriaceae bacterium]MCB9571025.1 hypothetical protein [Kofleriaceae bacterium]